MVVPYLKNATQDQIARLCHRRLGIGADGLMLLEKSDTLDFKMIYYNSDGNESTMCGNGGRAISHLAHFLRVFKHEASFEAIDGIHQVIIDSSGIVSLEMKEVHEIEEFDGGFILDTGSPHYVIKSKNVIAEDVFNRGRSIRNNTKFREEGVNVNFIQSQDDGLHVRTYERGVEAETLSCGTGVTAAAIVANHYLGEYIGKQNIPIVTSGGKLSVRFENSGTIYKNIWLTGPAKKVYEGLIEL